MSGATSPLRGGPRRGTAIAPGYRVLGRIHRSNVFDVFDAWSEARHCRCVVKTLRPDRVDDRSAARRLLAEGRRLRRYTHPHIVRAWEVHDGPRPLVVLETLTGETLAHLIDSAPRPLGAPDAAWLGLHLSSALRYLHADGLLHLDLKPSNVVAAGGRAVLIDLSVAQRPGRVPAGRGTWCYMAPEQARGGVVGPAADVWGLGMVLWEALAGAPAFPDTDTETPQLHAPVPRLGTRRRLRGALPALVDACLAPEAADRPTLHEVAAGLAAVAGADPRTA
ncbi:MAG TPA: serine/threonine-protein kinase [Miltoncostaeaceae bacterium]|nr:serine/threonine-protein kinase [Miltoncostaeaceae bacterium]